MVRVLLMRQPLTLHLLCSMRLAPLQMPRLLSQKLHPPLTMLHLPSQMPLSAHPR